MSDEAKFEEMVKNGKLEKIEYDLYNPDPDKGLTEEQVKERTEKGLNNCHGDMSSKTVGDIIKENCLTYFNMVFAVITVLVIISGKLNDLLFLPIIIANTCIGIVQEIHSKRVLDKLSVLNAAKANVIRDGKSVRVNADDVVLNDICEFTSGNQICADCVVKSGHVTVNESLITGESDEVYKGEGDKLLSGSFVVTGTCRAMAERVGINSYAAKLTLEAKKINNKEQSQMIRSMNRILIFLGIAIIPIGIILFVQQFGIKGYGFGESISTTVAAVIGMIPEGMYLLTSVALAVSAGRLALKKVMLHDMKCIETLARVNVLCLDKTGTITMPDMEMEGIVVINKDLNEEKIKNNLSAFVKAQDTINETSKAILNYFGNSGESMEGVSVPFSSAYKYSAVNTPEGKSYVLGAPEFLLNEKEEEYSLKAASLGKNGKRVLLFGTCNGTVDGSKITGQVEPMCLVVFSNPVRKEAVETFRYFKEQGVEIKVISGDNPVTVASVAKEAEIDNTDKYIDTSNLTDEELENCVNDYTVFGRVTPKQKRVIINAIKNNGNTVAMTGDGVNDVLALKDADCSIAMASGSDAASQAAQIVLMDSDFSKLPSVVYEGRRVVNNIQRSSSLFLVKNIFSLLLSISTIVLLLDYPLTPSQISLISTFTIGIPAFLLALESNFDIIKGGFVRNVLYKALPGGLTDFLMVLAFMIYSQVFELNSEDVSVVSTLLLAMVGFLILYKISQPLNKIRAAVLISMIVAFIVCGIYMNDIFDIQAISSRTAMLLCIFTIATESVFRHITKLFEFFSRMAEKIRNRKNKNSEKTIGNDFDK